MCYTPIILEYRTYVIENCKNAKTFSVSTKKKFVVMSIYLNGVNNTEVFFVEICKCGQYLYNNKEMFCTFLLFEFSSSSEENKIQKLVVVHSSAAINFIS